MRYAKVVAVIQARMGSSRLPGKSLMPIVGQPLIWHIVHRLRGSTQIDEIVLATTDSPRDDALAAWAAENAISCVRGSEHNVLSRFALAAEHANPDIIVRVNADAPLIDAAFIDAMVEAMLREDADFVTLAPGVVATHDGVDPMSRRALDLMLREAADDPVAREHVTGWLKQNQHRIKVAQFSPPGDYAATGLRLSIDTPDDVAFIDAVYDRLQTQAGEASLTDLIALIRRDPSLLAINGHVRQKTVTAASGTVLIRCDGGTSLGLGHVKRCLSLARAMRDGEGLGVRFAMIGEDSAAGIVQAAGFEVDRKPVQHGEAAWIAELCAERQAKALVLDIRTALSEADVLGLREAVPYIVALDDGSPRRLAADLAVYPPVPQTRSMSWPDKSVERAIGWDWTLLGSEAWTCPRPLSLDRSPLRVLVTMGGSDPLGLTTRAVAAVTQAGRRLTPVVVIGPSMADPDAVEASCRALSPDAEIHRAPPRLMDIAAGCDLALMAFGVSAFECAHLGLPAVYLGLTADHARSALAFHESGFGISLGVAEQVSDLVIADAVFGLAMDGDRRRAMAAAGRLAIDGRGAERLARKIARRIAANGLSRRKAG